MSFREGEGGLSDSLTGADIAALKLRWWGRCLTGMQEMNVGIAKAILWRTDT